MTKKCAVLQSNYIPWRGYFDIINDVDLFVFYDEVQFTSSDWRHRNYIYRPTGPARIIVPCGRNITRKISEVKMNDTDWQKSHYDKIFEAYRKAPHFSKYKSFFEYVYLERKWEYLSELNHYTIKHISTEFLGINTTFANSTDYDSQGQKSEKLLSLIKSTGYSHYLSGPAAKNYLDENAFNENGITVYWKDYSGYPEYPQTRESFEASVSIIDLLVNTGDDAPYYIWGWRQK